MNEAVATAAVPGKDPCYRFTLNVNGDSYTYSFRRPTRADQRDAITRCTTKMVGLLGLDIEAKINDEYDGHRRLWEARLELGFVSRQRGKEVLDFGESAPPHWYRPIIDDDGKSVGRMVTFDSVYPEEFDAVVAWLDAELKKKA